MICPFGILGYGVSGQATERLLLAAGVDPGQIFICDQKRPVSPLGRSKILSEAELYSTVRTLCVSPGVPLDQSALHAFSLRGRITSELEIATQFLDREKIICVTGSLGKSTTVALLGQAIGAFSSVFVGGNFGVPLATYVENKLRTGTQTDWLVLELSSYQLENYRNLRADASIFTFLTANHLERYSDKNAYYQSKWTLAERTIGPVIANRASGELVEFIGGKNSSPGNIHFTDARSKAFPRDIYKSAALIGQHHQDLFALVHLLAHELHWPASYQKPLLEFRGLPHRLENCGVHHGILWINDSKATAMPSVLVAVESAHAALAPAGRLHVLLGGRDKNLPWSELSPLKLLSNINFIFFGEAREVIQNRSALSGAVFTTCTAAVESARKIAKAGDVILLSPGGTSLDEFKSFEDRGNFFRNQAQN